MNPKKYDIDFRKDVVYDIGGGRGPAVYKYKYEQKCKDMEENNEKTGTAL